MDGIIKLLWAVLGLIYALKWAYWLQVKEYRWDRWRTWVQYNGGWKELLKLDIKKPEKTLRGLGILITSVIGIAVCGYWFWFLMPVGAFLGGWLGVVISQPVMEVLRQKEMERAKQLVDRIKPKVVMVNGSYGKSSTKEFLAQILENKFKIIKTEGNENTELGVARRILKSLKPGVEIMILEVGTYKQGELARICKMVRPDVVVITGMGPQHIDLFGSMENSRRAEFETVEALKPGGFVILNGDSPEERPMIDWTEKLTKNVIVYKVQKIVKTDINGFTMEVNMNGKPTELQIPVRGAHFGQNVLGAITAAGKLGMNNEDIKKAVQKLDQPPKSFKMFKTSRGIQIIDNSYNTNKEGFLASLDYLNIFAGKKYLITPGIIELGTETEKVHLEIGQNIAKFCDKVWVVKSDVAKYFASEGCKVDTIYNMGQMTEALQKLPGGVTVLIEGRIPPGWLSEIHKI